MRIPGMKPCDFCSKKNVSGHVNRLRQIRELTAKAKDTDKGPQYQDRAVRNALRQDSVKHCLYGLPCTAFNELATECGLTEENLCRYLRETDKGGLNMLLYLMRGYFPSAYRACERYWHISHSNKED